MEVRSLAGMVTGKLRLAWILVAALCLFTGWGFGQNTGQTVRHQRVAVEEPAPAELLQAETALDKKDFASAETLLKQAIAHDEKNYRAWFDLGYVYNATGRKNDAIEAYRKSVAGKPDVFESNLNLGLTLAQTGSPDAAQFLRAATQLKPSAHPEDGKARAWISLGHVLESSNPREALEAFGEAAKLQPNNPEPPLSTAGIREKQNDLAGAEREYQQASKLAPNSTEPLAGLVNLYMKMKRLPEAESNLRRYLALDPQNGRAHLQLGRILTAEGKPDEALKELNQGLLLSPHDAEAERDMASLYESSGKLAQAEAQYRSLLSKRPDQADLHYGLANILMKQHKFPEAQSELLSALKLQPNLAEAYGSLAVTASENGNYPLAVKALAARQQFLPETPATYFLRATAYDHLKQFKLAAENYHQFIASSGGKNPDQEWQAKHRLIAIEPKK
jgi:tetratricopeptide (TPR) repeat protein